MGRSGLWCWRGGRGVGSRLREDWRRWLWRRGGRGRGRENGECWRRDGVGLEGNFGGYRGMLWLKVLLVVDVDVERVEEGCMLFVATRQLMLEVRPW